MAAATAKTAPSAGNTPLLLAMTRSDGESVLQWRERWRIKSAMRVKGGALSVAVLFFVFMP